MEEKQQMKLVSTRLPLSDYEVLREFCISSKVSISKALYVMVHMGLLMTKAIKEDAENGEE